MYITDTSWKLKTHNNIRNIIEDTIGDNHHNKLCVDTLMKEIEKSYKAFFVETVNLVSVNMSFNEAFRYVYKARFGEDNLPFV